jgi:hypothetical protein
VLDQTSAKSIRLETKEMDREEIFERILAAQGEVMR